MLNKRTRKCAVDNHVKHVKFNPIPTIIMVESYSEIYKSLNYFSIKKDRNYAKLEELRDILMPDYEFNRRPTKKKCSWISDSEFDINLYAKNLNK